MLASCRTLSPHSASTTPGAPHRRRIRRRSLAVRGTSIVMAGPPHPSAAGASPGGQAIPDIQPHHPSVRATVTLAPFPSRRQRGRARNVCDKRKGSDLMIRQRGGREQFRAGQRRAVQPGHRHLVGHRQHDPRRPERHPAPRASGDSWHDNDLVFASRVGPALWAENVRRSFRIVLAAAGLNPAEWTPRALRHMFVSLMSDASCPGSQRALAPGDSACGAPVRAVPPAAVTRA